MRALRCRGVRKTGSRMEGGRGARGVVGRRGGRGAIRADCLDEEALKMVKGQRPGENLALSASPAKLNPDA